MIGNVKKMVVLILLLLGGVFVFLTNESGKNGHPKQNVDYNATICINERNERTEYLGALIVEKNDATIIVVPLIKTLSSLGVDVKWEDNNTAILRYKGKEYEADMREISFLPLYCESDNLLEPPPGSLYRSRIANDDILTEYGLFVYIATYMDINIVSVSLDDEPWQLTINFER